MSTSGSQPSIGFEHLLRLSDDTGLFEHARGGVPRREHGYCVDDVSRGLLVLSREPEPSPALVGLGGRYLAFLSHAQATDGTSRNRLGFDRHWKDGPATGDWWGRSLWGLGSAVSGTGPAWLRDAALDRFALGARARSPWPRARAFAVLGAAEVLSVLPDDEAARGLVRDAAPGLARPGPDAAWPWPEERLTYANATLAEATIAAGDALDDDDAIDDGLRLLGWLVDQQTNGDHLSTVPAGGRAPGDPRPGFDQQPIEVAALADACARAFTVTGADRWRVVVARCVGWFLGSNDVGVAMHDPLTGGGYDGLEAGGRNDNRGAESTLAWLLTLQHGRRMALDPDLAGTAS